MIKIDGKWWKMMEIVGKIVDMIENDENGGNWWKLMEMVEIGEIWWKLLENDEKG